MTTKAITGLQGEGKTHLAMQWIRDAIKAGRPVHTNIEGIRLEGVEDIPENENGELDWQLCPQADADTGQLGALVIYDEAQKLKDKNGKKYFAYVAREKLSERDIISELDEHRHKGYDIVFITQEANLLHLHLLSLIKEHYHCSRPHNRADGSQVALWRSMQKFPNGSAALERAEDVYFSKFDPEIFKLYKSTEMVTDGKTRWPKYLKKLAAIGVACLIGIVGLFIFVDNPMFNLKAMKALTGDKEGIDEVSKYMPILQQKEKIDAAMKSIDNKDLDFECRKGVNIDKPECKEYFNNKSKNNQSFDYQSTNNEVVYNPNKPYDFEYTPTVKPTDFPRMSGVIKAKNGRLIALDQQGNYMLEVSQKDCQRWLDGYRPFNYFASQKSGGSSNQNKEGSELTTTVLKQEIETPKIGL